MKQILDKYFTEMLFQYNINCISSLLTIFLDLLVCLFTCILVTCLLCICCHIYFLPQGTERTFLILVLYQHHGTNYNTLLLLWNCVAVFQNKKIELQTAYTRVGITCFQLYSVCERNKIYISSFIMK